MSLSIKNTIHKIQFYLHHKGHQTHRLSRKTIELFCLLLGALFVSIISLGFALLAEVGLAWNYQWNQQYPLLAWIILPIGITFLAWFTHRYAPYVVGSGIPQVIASLSLPHNANKNNLIKLWPTLWKIPLTFMAMLLGASVGREGPSVQVGAAVMLSWGNFCRKYNLAFKGLTTNELIAIGASGGLAAAFNAPLAGVIFTIEELGRNVVLRWERRILLGILASGFFLIAIQGNNPYFPEYHGPHEIYNMYLWIILCAMICGVSGGVFARLLSKGIAAYSPNKFRGWVRKHPLTIAFLLGLVLAALGHYSSGKTYGTGYPIVENLLNNHTSEIKDFAITKFIATITTYWANIAGGIFTPALTIGSAIGATIAEYSGSIVDQRLLVLLSMAAFLAGVTQAPLTASVVVMEMTGSQTLLFWMLVGCLIASFISRQINPRPFYHVAAGKFRQHLQEKTVQYNQNKENHATPSL